MKSQCTLDLYYPKNKKNFATVVWFHGGGLTGGKKEIPKQLMENGFAIIGVGYRLSPKVKGAACIEDAAAAASWAFHHIAEYGGNQDGIFLSGHSAGAYLSLMITMDKKYLNKYNIDANKVAGVISLSSQTITHFTIRQERGIKGTQPIIDEYAPLYHVRQDLPPIILITGDAEKEMLGRYEENAYLYRMLLLNKAEQVKLYKMDGYDHGSMPLASYPLMIKEIARLYHNHQ
jgi:acetyl esterase/lipase